MLYYGYEKGVPMTHEHAPIDISHVPELVHLAEEVRQSRAPRVLRHADTDVAVLAPLEDTSTKAGEDVEALIARLHRNLAARTPVPLGTDTVQLIYRARARRTRHLRPRE